MKIIKLLFFILFLPFYSFCQSLTGLWMGSLTNDSNTIRRDQSFEMALTEYKGKVYGYSHTTFMVHDTLYYIVKRVRGSINGDVCEVKDDEIISCNFLTKPDKGVKQISTFHFNKEDSVWRLDGEWKTTKTKKFYSISGSVKTAVEKDLTKSKLFPHLQELNLTADVAAAFTTTKKETEPVKQSESKEPLVAKAGPLEVGKKKDTPPVKTETVVTNPTSGIAKTNTEKEKPKESTPAKIEPTVTSQTETVKTKTETEKKKEDLAATKETVTATPQPGIAKTNTGKEKLKQQSQTPTEAPVISPTEIAKSKTETEKKKENVKDAGANPIAADMPAKLAIKNELPTKPIAAVNVEKRKSVTQQTVDFTNDSLSIALYDNGEIDGDTVSVLVNGEIIMANQGLKASAIRKTIYITPAMSDSFTLVLYAENLGKYPPNTGLMIVHDGDEVYQVRFSADLQKNVAVIFKRKKK
ncbi:MAG: hypothetical protein JWM28_3234 [Chitinophagaceae bacterium]|nr:hypothetical protein [Chitinophagaceae bacterium]